MPLRARVRVDRRPAPDRSEDDGCPARHCWVSEAVDEAGEKRPGLLLEWRQSPSGWEGLVVYAARLRVTPARSRWGLVQEWLPGDLLTPR